MPHHYRESINDFETYLRVERNLSPRTRAAYCYDLNRFGEWLTGVLNNPNPPLRVITVHHIKDYLAGLQEDRRYRPTTLSRVIATLRVFFEFCVTQGKLETSPALTIHNPKLPRRLPIYLIESELQRLLAAPDPNDAAAVRDYAILVTLGFTGVRLQELVGLDTTDIDFERRTVKVMGKGSKERLIPLNTIVIQALQDWLLCRPGTEDTAVFLNRFGRRLSGRSVENIVKKYVRQAGITKAKVSPHKLRHTFATLLHVNDVDLVEIQTLMGHASITSTQIYTHTNAGKLRSAVSRLEQIGVAPPEARKGEAL
jgi:site-specific recombinase XerD